MARRTNEVFSRLDGRAQEFIYALSRKGVYARPAQARNGIVKILRERPAGIKSVGDCPQSIWTKFVGLGLVSGAGPGQDWKLTNLGKDVAKVATPRSGHGGTKCKSQQRPSNFADGVSARRNHHESPLAWLAQRKGRDGKPMVSEEQFQAGERLRRDFFRANLNPKVTMDWSMALSASGSSRRGGSDHMLISDVAASARAKVNAALLVVGPELASILIDVCCHLKGLEVSEQQAGWPRRSGKVILQLALTRLARHYGLVPDEASNANRKGDVIRHWGGTGYRPQIDGEPEIQSVD